jgi:glucose/arabinose dehydrogenase
MRKLLFAALAACIAASANAAVAELNPATGTIESSDGLFVGRDFTMIRNFKLELLYTPNTASEGQWVPMTWDSQGRLIVASYNSDHLLRLTIPRVGSNEPVRTERIMNEVGAAEGLVEAFGGLYMNVNRSNIRRHGIYKLTDNNNDDQFDTIRVIRNLRGSGDHGTHALHLAPDGQSIYVLSGNATPLTNYTFSRVPEVWGEDNLVMRVPMGAPGPGRSPESWVMNFNPEGTEFKVFAIGMRNPVDFSFNKDGEMFLYDSDMEFDMGSPWYVPTNVQHVTSGSDVGWRDGSRKHPLYYMDYFGTIGVVGSGSPVGSIFGTGAKFPARYQDAMFIADWSYGNLWAMMIEPDGASYKGEATQFISGRPFAVSGVIVNPADGSLLVQTTGTQFYRVSYTGPESTQATRPDSRFSAMRALRHSIEQYHGYRNPAAIGAVWDHLGDSDRAIRNAARIALEWQDPALWRDRAIAETDVRKSIAAIVALARTYGPDIYNRPADAPPYDRALQNRMVEALDRIDYGALSVPDKLDLLRAYQLTFIRLGPPSQEVAQRLIAKFDPHFPANYRELNWEVGEMLTYLQAPSAAGKLMGLLRTTGSAPMGSYFPNYEYINPLHRARNTPGSEGGDRNAFLAKQMDEIQYAQYLRTLTVGWTPELRREYLEWFGMAARTYSGGNQFAGFQQAIRADAISQIPANERAAVQDLIDQELTYNPSRNVRGGAGAVAPAAAGRGGQAGGRGGL